MSSSLSRKRLHDADDHVMSMHHDKRLRRSASAGNVHSEFGVIPLDAQSSSGADLVFETDSSDDVDLEMADDFDMELSQSPEQSSSWSLGNAPLRNPRMALDDRGSRVPTPIALLSTRPKPALLSTRPKPALLSTRPKPTPLSTRPKPTPLQGNTSASSAYTASLSMRARLPAASERFPSPISEDEPHTPTAATGSQFSLLTVNDMDMDVEAAPRPAPQTPEVHVRKQRARSGAFTSPRDNDISKKFSMGYREDCEKCRNRVPGHMNHFSR